MRKERILVADPDATDFSSVKKNHSEFLIDEDNKDVPFAQSSMENDVSCESDHVDGNPIKKYVGVCRRKSGKFGAEINDPFKKKRLWLGSFNTPEEASMVYLNKKLEIEKEVASRKLQLQGVVSNKPVPDSHTSVSLSVEEDVPMQNNKVSMENVVNCDSNGVSGKNIKKNVGVNKTTFSARITDPFKKKRVWLGSFNTPEEASRAYLSRKLEIEKKLASRKLWPVVSKQSKPVLDHVDDGVIASENSASENDKTEGARSIAKKGLVHENFYDKVDHMSREFERIYPGAYKRKSGRYSSEIQHPITKKKVCLGTFDTAEEAFKYSSKKLEFHKEYKSRKSLPQVLSKESNPLPDFDGSDLCHGGNGRSNSNEEKSVEEDVAMQNNEASTRQQILPISDNETFQIDSNCMGHRRTPYRSSTSSKKTKDVTFVNSSLENVVNCVSGKQIKKYVGVNKTTFSARINDPFKKQRVWLGTFNTPEEASRVYLNKKLEIEKEVASRKLQLQLQDLPDSHTSVSSNVAMQNNKGSMENIVNCDSNGVSGSGKNIMEIVGVNKTTFSARINDPFEKKRVWLGTFNTREEASRVYLSKKLEIDKKLACRMLQPVVSKESKPVLDYVDDDVIASENLAFENDDTEGTRPIEKRGLVHENFNDKVNGVTSKQLSVDNVVNFQVDHTGREFKRIYPGVYKRKLGRYASAITDPTTRKRVWLGTFSTPEEASRVYLSKKLEIDKKLACRMLRPVVSKQSKPVLDYVDDGVIAASENGENEGTRPIAKKCSVNGNFNDKVKGVTSKQLSVDNVVKSQVNHTGKQIKGIYPGVYKRKPGRYCSKITDPITRKEVWLGTFNTPEEAFKVYSSKKLEFHKEDESKKRLQRVLSKESNPFPDIDGSDQNIEDALGSNAGSLSSVLRLKSCESPSSILQVKDNKDSMKGPVVQDSHGEEVDLSNESTIMDNHGYLLGKWSWIDDLSISGIEETRNV